ncbi:hypothetical protein HAX54_048947 [Datura stramonium]|uniref:Uncharacterized protein n=1 Tax=Datura stramonium TaxID=4076 RepID=A0ABS8SUE3_DATST|nr:hypothetical protein [Datura stramonium]
MHSKENFIEFSQDDSLMGQDNFRGKMQRFQKAAGDGTTHSMDARVIGGALCNMQKIEDGWKSNGGNHDGMDVVLTWQHESR